MLEKIKILCVDDEQNVLKALRRLFMDEESYELFVAESGAEGLDILEEEGDIRMVVSDYRMPEMTGVEFLRQVYEKWPETMRIVLSGYADTAAVVEAINEGQIYKFIPKPWNDEDLLSTISAALDYQALQWENKKLSAELQKKNFQLREVNENLEEQVIKRTEALDIRNRILQVSQGVLDVLPVVVFGIDPENLIVHCNEFARELFPHGGMGPLGHDREDVFPDEINALIDRLEHEPLPKAAIAVHHQKFRGEVRRLHDTELQGMVLVLIPES
ncbi:response regulator [uncultured Desulfuromusa sp.]|uniref:response regulator n=1 Tax=uncultured Desulfuromusa sp. TaxID=219183 RepID=UPI002AA808E4|nr:response regulator [uncultured Desulfuromusa sp.]